MENSKVIAIAELVNGGRAVTGASSIYISAGRSTCRSSSESDRRSPQSSAFAGGSGAKPKVLTAVNLPSVLVGTIALPSESLECPNRYCLQFSDFSETICCDVIALEVGAIGKKICVLAWNFIPMECHGGFLEIIKWKLLDCGKSLGRCSTLDSFPLVPGSNSEENGDLKSRYRVHGVIESISPVSIVPCLTASRDLERDSNGPVNLRGFLVRIMACECRLCIAKERPKLADHVHSFAKAVFIYFCGSAAASWHSVMMKLIGSIVSLLGVKKKLVYLSNDNSQLVFVTTENSVLHLPRFSKKWLGFSRTAVERRSKCGAYIGVVKGVYLGGMLVEMDEDVWLLLTDRIHNWPHSLRAGALISIRNVHFVNPKYSWGKMLILGACFKTSITVECFSPLETDCLVDKYMWNSLREFIESLSFSARFWALLVVSCFQKFIGIFLSEKEILGSSQKDGLTKTYAKSHIPTSMFQPRRGLFTEFCMHESCECNSEPNDCNLKLVVPVSSFVQHYKVMLNKLFLGSKKDGDMSGVNSCSVRPLLLWRPYDHSTTEILLSKDIGVILVGSLKISSSSGRLQLHDGTGNIDVVVMDLPANTSAGSIYEVTDYSLIVEGVPELMRCLLFPQKPFFNRSVVNCDPLTTEYTWPMFMSLCLNSTSRRYVQLYPRLDCKRDLNEIEGGTFHLFRVTHKFPILQNVNAVMSKSSSIFAEAIIFPWYLICTAPEGKMGSVIIHKSGIFPGKHPSKRCKTGDTSWKEVSPSIPDTSHEIPCQLTVRLASHHSLVTSGILCHAKGNECGDSSYKQRVKKVLLEFGSEWEKYNWLQIGGCYLMKHDSGDSFCFGRSGIFNNDNIRFRPESRVWSLDFSFDEVLTHDQSTDGCFLVYEGLSGQPKEQQKVFSSNVLLQLPYVAKRIFSIYLKDLEEELTKPTKETSNASSCAWGAMTPGLSSRPSLSNSLFPEGNLASFKGDVIAVDMVEPCGAGVLSSYSVLVSVNEETVKILGSLSRHAYLTGFGPGVNATFYRVLAMRVENMFLLSPASFIKINSLKAVDDPYTENLSHPFASCKHGISSEENASACSISNLILRCDNKPGSLVCKVLTVHLLILQKFLGNLSENRPRPNIVPLAGFVVDDGSSTCLCWAEGKSASTFLRLHEGLPDRAIDDDAWIRKGGSWSTIIFHLERIVQKHKRIVVKNVGSQVDRRFQDFTISVGSHHPLTDSENKFLTFLILNSTSGPLWAVTGSSLDAETIKRLEREGAEIRTSNLPLPNIWAAEVVQVDALARANSLLQGLLNTKR